MKYILDTHVLLWWMADDSKLDQNKRQIISDRKNIIFISAVNAWEIEIKRELGKLKIPKNFYEIIKSQSFTELPIKIEHTIALQNLEKHHADPFDRLLIAQSLVERCILLSSDLILKRYLVDVI